MNGIRKVCLSIAYSNDMINRSCSEDTWWKEAEKVVQTKLTQEQISLLDEFCSSLTDQQVELLADGEESEMEEIIEQFSNPELTTVFDDVFNMPIVED